MSTGTRLPLAMAQDAARALMNLWRMPTDSCMVVGSVRRGREEVGDLEFTARMPVDKDRDELYRSISGTLKTDGLFGGTPNLKTYGVAISGFKPGFKFCSLTMTLERGVESYKIPVQIHRYAHSDSNRGWIELMRTGPSEFGQMFLRRWKERHGIPPANQSSDEGHLLDASGARVSVPTEQAAFELCGLQFIDPGKRDAIGEIFRRAGGGN